MSEQKYYRIENFNDIINIGVAFCANFFRGHSKVVDDLIPKVYRSNFGCWEKKTTSEFLKYGRNYVSQFPSNKLEILYLMQHYGTPTRLLDWTENILVALYFAVSEDKDSDGEIWILNPQYIDEEIKKLDYNYSNLLEVLCLEPFLDNSDSSIDFKSVIPVYIRPNYTNSRMNSQQSIFTIHPNHNTNGIKLTDCLTNVIALDKLIIPKEKKSLFEDYLYFLGFSNRTLFPDLTNLSLDIQKNKIKKIINREEGLSVTNFLKIYSCT